jgi:hypothetical protein
LSLSTKISIAILALAVSLFSYGYFSYARYAWVAAKKQIDVSNTNTHELSFISQMDSGYELELLTERNLDFKEQNCRLGIETDKKNECGDFKELLVIDWSIRQAGTEVASGKSNKSTSGFWGRRTMGKTLHRFKTEKGKKYIITAKTRVVDPALAITNPLIKVSVGRMEHKNAYVFSSLSFYASYFLGGIAVIIWLAGIIYRWLIVRKSINRLQT